MFSLCSNVLLRAAPRDPKGGVCLLAALTSPPGQAGVADLKTYSGARHA
jgi:hypothetical protein